MGQQGFYPHASKTRDYLPTHLHCTDIIPLMFVPINSFISSALFHTVYSRAIVIYHVLLLSVSG
jgi:hypothetical protein